MLQAGFLAPGFIRRFSSKRRKPPVTPSQNRNIRFQWHIVTVVTGYSGASAAESHGLPKYNPKGSIPVNDENCIWVGKKVKQQINR